MRLFWIIIAITFCLYTNGALFQQPHKFKYPSRLRQFPNPEIVLVPQYLSQVTLSTVYAAPQGSTNAAVCGSIDIPCNLPTALNITSTNGILILLDGTYIRACTLYVTKNITINAQNYGNAVVDCQQNNYARAFMVSDSVTATFTGITIQNTLSDYGSGIYSTCDLLIIDSCKFINNTGMKLILFSNNSSCKFRSQQLRCCYLSLSRKAIN